MHWDKQQNKLVIKVKKTEQGTEQVAEQDWRIEQAKKIEFSSSEKMFFKLEVEHMDKNVCAFLLSSIPPTKEVIHHVQQISCGAEQGAAFGAD